MAEGKKLAIQKRGREVELRNVEKPRGAVLPMMAYTERPSLACMQALLFGRVKRTARERASDRRSREGPTTTFNDILQMESLLAG